jgi:hypothetical protein
MAVDKARFADPEFDDFESHWMSPAAERYRYPLLFSMLAGLAAVGLIFWRSHTMIASSKSEAGRKRQVRQSKQRAARRRRKAPRSVGGEAAA